MNNRRRQQEEAWGLLGAIGWPPLGLEDVASFSGELIPGGISYTLYDTFSTDFAAGSVNGTLADTGQARTVTDTNSKLSITGGKASIDTGGVGVGDPGLWYPQMTRQAGIILLGNVVMTTGVMNFGWDASQVGNIQFAFRPLVGNSIGVLDNSTTIAIAAAPTTGIVYQMAVVLRGTGCWYFIKGGAFTNWTLAWISSLNNANLFPGFVTGSTADVFTVDDVRVPAGVTFIPNPLAYDTFTRANGALGSTETTGPDSQAISALAWQFTSGIWTISTNAAIATPTVGADVIVNGAFAADTDWTKGSGWAIGSGTANATASSADLTQTTPPLTVGRWYQVQYTVSGYSAGNVQARVGSIGLPTLGGNGTVIQAGKADTTAFLMRGSGFTGSVDNVSAKLLVTAELFSSVQVATADVIAEVGITLVTGRPVGLVLNLDSISNPQNFIIVYMNANGSLITEECVAGSYTTKATTSITYSAGAILRVVREGTQLRPFYNGGTAGGVLTMAANTGTLHGLFSTNAGNSLDNFLLWNRGTDGSYSTLNNY